MASGAAQSPAPRVVLGVGGGIAAYKACELLRRLTESGHDVTVVPTASALRFVGAPTWEALSGHPVSAEVWESVSEVPHVRLGKQADLVVVAPATADLLARAAHGLADDLLTNTLLTARCPVLFAPAMHTEMWQHAATVENVATLRRRGAIVLDPAVGRLTGADTGPGRLPEPEEIFETALCLLNRSLLNRSRLNRGLLDRSLPDHGLPQRGTAAPDLAGLRVLITAGGTREPLDPVRYLGNRSSGLQGYALARAAVARGAEVTLIAANVALPDPAGVKMLHAGTALELRDEVRAAAVDADVVVMSAAVADFRPADYAEAKIKKTDDTSAPELTLVQNPHVLREIGHERLRAGQTVVGFAAETGDAEHSALDLGRRKLAKYRVDLLVVNEVGVDKVFGRPETEAVILDAAGTETAVPPGPKSALAEEIWDRVAAWRARG